MPTPRAALPILSFQLTVFLAYRNGTPRNTEYRRPPFAFMFVWPQQLPPFLPVESSTHIVI